MNNYLTSLCESLQCPEDVFNSQFFEAFFALEHEYPASYLVSAHQCIDEVSEFSDEDFVVIPMFGKKAKDLGNLGSDFDVAVKPRRDGTRVSCYMFADGKVALNTMALHWAGACPGESFRLLWLFDDEARVTSHFYSDDVNDAMCIAQAIADDHEPLTAEERRAWQSVAAQAKYIGFFENIDLRDEQ
jgi:hypothetical protein